MVEQQKIDITKLDPEQLLQFRKQFQDELEHFNTSLNALQLAMNKYKENVANIEQVSQEENQKKEILVPLSSSLYVPGKIKDNEKYLIDVGTGYFIEKNSKDSIKFYNQKITQLTSDFAKVNEIINEKSQTLQRIDQILRMKVKEAEKVNSKV